MRTPEVDWFVIDSIGAKCCTAKEERRQPKARMPRASSFSKGVFKIEDMHTKFEYRVYTLRITKNSGK